MQRVILITPGFTADVYDQNCLPTLQLYVEALLQHGVDVQVVALDYPFSNQSYSWKGAQVHPCGGRNSRWLKPRTLWRALHICAQLVRETPPGYRVALHSFWLGWASGIGERVARQEGIQHITTLMGQDVLPQNRHRFRFLTAGRKARLAVLSHFQNEVLEKNAGLKADHVIPWGVSQAEIPKMQNENRPIDILGAGSLIPLKNWDLWLDTVAITAQAQPLLKAMILGNGPERVRLEHKARQLGLGQTVVFAGELSRPKVLEKMQQTKILLHTSHFESQGYVLSEAAMNGCQIVGTPVGIAPEMGLCAETSDELAALACGILGAPFVATAKTPYLMSETIKAYMALYTISV